MLVPIFTFLSFNIGANIFEVVVPSFEIDTFEKKKNCQHFPLEYIRHPPFSDHYKYYNSHGKHIRILDQEWKTQICLPEHKSYKENE